MELKNCVSKAFEDSCKKYSEILNSGFKPWANNKKASIHETNMVMNFMESYKSQRENDCVTWVEFAVPYRKDMQDKKRKINHIDGFIVDGTRVILIEAKRLSKVEERKKELETDLSVLVDVFKDKESLTGLISRLPSGRDYKFYCLLLADFWANRNIKTGKKMTVLDWKDWIKSLYNNNDTKSYLGAYRDDCVDMKEVFKYNYHLAYALFELPDFK